MPALNDMPKYEYRTFVWALKIKDIVFNHITGGAVITPEGLNVWGREGMEVKRI